MMKDDCINKINTLKSLIAEFIREHSFDENGDIKVFWFRESIESPTFKITIKNVELNFFVDQNGQKWIKHE